MTHPRRGLLLIAFVASLVMVSVGAVFTVLFGDIPTWFAILLLVGFLALAMWAWSPGPRSVPHWMLLGAGALMVVGAMALELELELRLSALTLLVGVGAVLFVRRMPAAWSGRSSG